MLLVEASEIGASEDHQNHLEVVFDKSRSRDLPSLYGHIAANCRKEKHMCSVCAGSHSYEECQTKGSKKCVNCGGAHSVSFCECPKYVVAEQVNIVQLQTI